MSKNTQADRNPPADKTAGQTKPRGKGKKYLVGLPITVWLVLIIIVPILIMFATSFYKKVGSNIEPIFNFGNYAKFFTDSIYIPIFFKTLLLALAVSISSIVLGYPLAYLVSRKVKRFRNQLYMLILVPLWVSYLVRIVAWRAILGRGGVLNTLLLDLHLIKEPISLFIYNPFAIFIVLTHISLPFVFISIFTSLEKIPKNLINAAADLGANGPRTLKEIIIPLSMPGVLSGFTMAFVTALGDYIIPQQLGGPNGLMFGNLIVSQFGYAYNWPLGAALGFIMFGVAVLILALSNKASASEGYLE
ncbi:MAG: ABC transporter permease [Clostridia bacterium]|nr:ABC transporter permease [Clostridia bacterium]